MTPTPGATPAPQFCVTCCVVTNLRMPLSPQRNPAPAPTPVDCLHLLQTEPQEHTGPGAWLLCRAVCRDVAGASSSPVTGVLHGTGSAACSCLAQALASLSPPPHGGIVGAHVPEPEGNEANTPRATPPTGQGRGPRTSRQVCGSREKQEYKATGALAPPGAGQVEQPLLTPTPEPQTPQCPALARRPHSCCRPGGRGELLAPDPILLPRSLNQALSAEKETGGAARRAARGGELVWGRA